MATGQGWSVYMLRCRDGSLYVGIAKDVVARVEQHQDGSAADHTARRRPVTLVWQEEHASKSAARRREMQLKRWRKAKKEALIRGFPSAGSG